VAWVAKEARERKFLCWIESVEPKTHPDEPRGVGEEEFIAQKPCDGAGILASRTSFGMMGGCDCAEMGAAVQRPYEEKPQSRDLETESAGRSV
jgi:hypothetical protein